MPYHVQNASLGLVTARRSMLFVSVASIPSPRSDHQNVRPECGSVGMRRLLVGPLNFSVIFPFGSSTYLTEYSCTLDWNVPPTSTLSPTTMAAGCRAGAPCGYRYGASELTPMNSFAATKLSHCSSTPSCPRCLSTV